MIIEFLAFAMLIQQSDDKVYAEYPENEETWVLEYPVAISHYVDDYYSCLKSGSYEIGGNATFIDQYKKDIPRCAKKGEAWLTEAKARLSGSSSADTAQDWEVDRIFETVRRIHLARGRDLDNAINTRLASEADRRKNQPAMSAEDAAACKSVVASLVQERQKYVETEGERIENIYAQPEYSLADQVAIHGYQGQLARYSTRISAEMRRCPAANG